MQINYKQKLIISIYCLLVFIASVLWVPHKVEGVNVIAAARGSGDTIVRFDTNRAPIWVLPKDNGDINIKFSDLDSCGVSINYQGILTEIFILTLIFGCLFFLAGDRAKSSN